MASNCGGNPEVIKNGKNGFLVEYNNGEQIKRAIKKSLTTPKSDFVFQAGFEKFTWETNINKTVKTIKEVL